LNVTAICAVDSTVIMLYMVFEAIFHIVLKVIMMDTLLLF